LEDVKAFVTNKIIFVGKLFV